MTGLADDPALEDYGVAVAEGAEAERRTGYVRGGISPLGQRQPLPIVLDNSAQPSDDLRLGGQTPL
jgi:Cys-tRNA(Pro)/Cys-tRNA(Cys) deacylase